MSTGCHLCSTWASAVGHRLAPTTSMQVAGSGREPGEDRGRACPRPGPRTPRAGRTDAGHTDVQMSALPPACGPGPLPFWPRHGVTLALALTTVAILTSFRQPGLWPCRQAWGGGHASLPVHPHTLPSPPLTAPEALPRPCPPVLAVGVPVSPARPEVALPASPLRAFSSVSLRARGRGRPVLFTVLVPPARARPGLTASGPKGRHRQT